MSIKKIPFVYIYYINENRFSKYCDLAFERQTFNYNPYLAQEYFFANDFKNGNWFEINELPNKVLYKADTNSYAVWMTNDDEVHALHLIGLELISDITELIARTSSQIEQANETLTNFYDFFVNNKVNPTMSDAPNIKNHRKPFHHKNQRSYSSRID